MLESFLEIAPLSHSPDNASCPFGQVNANTFSFLQMVTSRKYALTSQDLVKRPLPLPSNSHSGFLQTALIQHLPPYLACSYGFVIKEILAVKAIRQEKKVRSNRTWYWIACMWQMMERKSSRRMPKFLSWVTAQH